MSESSKQVIEPSLSSSSEDVDESVCGSGELKLLGQLSEAEQKRLSLIQTLCGAQQHSDYGQHQQMVATQLGLTVRSVRRLVQRYRRGCAMRHSMHNRVEIGAKSKSVESGRSSSSKRIVRAIAAAAV
jgi:hypothetical protein